MKLTSITKFPVKSLKPVSLESAVIDEFGIVGDRRFMLTDSDGQFLTQRRYPSMGAISVKETSEGLLFEAPHAQPLSIMMSDFVSEVSVGVWSDSVRAVKAGKASNQWFSEFFSQTVQLVFMPDSEFRQVEPEYVPYPQRVSFADAYPFLLISESSLIDLNSRLGTPVSMSRFRPNLVVSGCDAFEEDTWHHLRIGGVEFEVVKPCTRCVMTTIDETTLKKGKEPLKTLATYRRSELGVCFGQNLVHKQVGSLKVGDRVEVLSRK